MRGLKVIERFKSSQVHAFNPTTTTTTTTTTTSSDTPRQPKLKLKSFSSNSKPSSDSLTLLYGLPSPDSLEPHLDTHLKPLDVLHSLSDLHRRFDPCSSDTHKVSLCLEKYTLLRGLGDPKLLRRCLLEARLHAPDVLARVVLSAWLRFERREDELAGVSAMDCAGFALECPTQTLVGGFGPNSAQLCSCGCGPEKDDEVINNVEICESESESDNDDAVSFWVGGEEIRCFRGKIAKLSSPLEAMLCGGFKEAKMGNIDFSQSGVSAEGMAAVEEYSRTKRVDRFGPRTVVEILSLANRFCCEEMKSNCDSHLASLVETIDEALVLIEYGLQESAGRLVASCLQVLLRELPGCLYRPRVIKFLCSSVTRERLIIMGKNSSFLMYYLLSQVAMEESMVAKTTVKLLKRLRECGTEKWQIALAFHQLGCVLLQRSEFMAAQRCFEASVEAGHVYSNAGVARAKHKMGQQYSAYKLMSSVLADHKPQGWMYQERSLYNVGREKVLDLSAATETDPTLSFPFECRAVLKLEEKRIHEAISEIDKVVGFRLSTGCLELRAWLLIAFEDYERAARDVRVLLTLDPDYVMFGGKVRGDCLVEVLSRRIPKLSQADCWMCLYDRWSSVDDIGSLAIIHRMLETDPVNSVLRFRQSLLLLRLNCQKAAMRSLRLARNHSSSEHERLVYEGWILYDTGNREEALSRAEKSILKQRSFEAFFLKAYVLADASLNPETSSAVIQLLEEALRCPSDGLRKGQALNNLGSIYVDCGLLDRAAECYNNALDIKHTRAHQGLARVYHLRSQRKTAYDEMAKLIGKAPNNASAYEKRSEYCDRDMAKYDLDMATELDPLRTYPYRYRAAVLMDDQKESEAIEELSKALSFRPDLQMLHLRAAFYDSIGDTACALRDCEAALCVDPNHSETLDLYNRAHNSATQK